MRRTLCSFLLFFFFGIAHAAGPAIGEMAPAALGKSRDGKQLIVMHPQKRTYPRGQVQTESAVDAGVFRDLYVALGEPMDAGNIEGAWSLRLTPEDKRELIDKIQALLTEYRRPPGDTDPRPGTDRAIFQFQMLPDPGPSGGDES